MKVVFGGKMLSHYINKEVLCVKNAQYEGIVIGAYLNMNTYRVVGLAVKNENMRILPVKKILGKDDKITISSPSALIEPTSEHVLLTAGVSRCYSVDGAFIGALTDLMLKGSPLLIWFDKPYPIKKIAAINGDTLTLDLRRRSNPPKRTPKPNENYDFLIGSILLRDIADTNGNVLFKKGSVVNQNMLSAAKDAGRLMQLALSVLLY